MNKKIYLIASFLIVVIAFILAGVLYSTMPDKIASHWGASGQVNGYMSKSWGVFMPPAITLILFIFFLVLPRLDPLKKNVKEFENYYYGFITVIILFLFYVYLLTIFWNQGYKLDIIRFLIPGFAVLMYTAGIVMAKSKQNWFLGIRTPWTLSSEIVWNKTHQLGAKLFEASAIISLIGFFVKQYAIWLIIIPVILSAITAFIYSYLIYKKEKI